MAENPYYWTRVEGSLAVGDLNNPAFVWAFLVVQELVRDLPGDRETFYRIVTEQQQSNEIGASSVRRISVALSRAGIVRPSGDLPDPDANIAQRRKQVIKQWLKAVNTQKLSVDDDAFCVYCGFIFDASEEEMRCSNCARPRSDWSGSREIPCPRCERLNWSLASFCEFCSNQLVELYCYQCQNKVQPQALFCTTCGLKMDTADKRVPIKRLGPPSYSPATFYNKE